MLYSRIHSVCDYVELVARAVLYAAAAVAATAIAAFVVAHVFW